MVETPSGGPLTPSKGKARALEGEHASRIDLPSLNASYQRWLSVISQKRRRKLKPSHDEDWLEIYDSVFEGLAPELHELTGDPFEIRTLDDLAPDREADFDKAVTNVKQAIESDVHPRLNSKGSSGSYFAMDSDKQVIGIFKPKDEEPYGRLNPKWLKWFHRNLVAPIFPSSFGRSCLIPNLSYLSETAACVLDRHLQLYIVPRTGVASLASKSFFYDWIDRRAANLKKHAKPLPEKIGSLQLFAQGFEDASEFLNKHPWPYRAPSESLSTGPRSRHRRKRHGSALFRFFTNICGKAEAEEAWQYSDDEVDSQGGDSTPLAESKRFFFWSEDLQRDFREQLERLIVLDFLMRNTDRGLDNFMLKYCPGDDTDSSRHACNVINEQPKAARAMSGIRPVKIASSTAKGKLHHPHLHLAAIDNSLAFPHSHPTGYRSFPFGWLFLPASLIGLPWSQSTRDHFSILLTDTAWWEDLVADLRRTFKQDKDFNTSMFRKQIAVIKGQALNLLQSLSDAEEGPLELCQRHPLLVWDDYIEKPTETTSDMQEGIVPESQAADEEGEDQPLISPRSQPAVKEKPFAFLLPTKRARGVSLSEVPRFNRKISSPLNAESSIPGYALITSGNTVTKVLGARQRSNSQSDLSRPKPPGGNHTRMASSGFLQKASDMVHSQASLGPSLVVVERIEIVKGRPNFVSC